MLNSKYALPAALLAVVAVVFSIPVPGSEDLIAVCKGDGEYPIKRVTDLFGRVSYINQNNDKIKIPTWCDLEEDKNGDFALVLGTEYTGRSGM